MDHRVQVIPAADLFRDGVDGIKNRRQIHQRKGADTVQVNDIPEEDSESSQNAADSAAEYQQ